MSKRAISKRASEEARSRKAQKRQAKAKVKAQGVAALPVLRPNTAGIDIGAMEIFVAVSPDVDEEHVRSFSTFTRDLGG